MAAPSLTWRVPNIAYQSTRTLHTYYSFRQTHTHLWVQSKPCPLSLCLYFSLTNLALYTTFLFYICMSFSHPFPISSSVSFRFSSISPFFPISLSPVYHLIHSLSSVFYPPIQFISIYHSLSLVSLISPLPTFSSFPSPPSSSVCLCLSPFPFKLVTHLSPSVSHLSLLSSSPP